MSILDPAHILFQNLQAKKEVQVWITESSRKLEGNLTGMDEFMNLILDSPVEVQKNGSRRELHKPILLRGDAIAMVFPKN